ncbi:MAG: DMT family transporter [Chloroflexi bacterium]|nr:DMT family transporter [Chloroflexota bacterium]
MDRSSLPTRPVISIIVGIAAVSTASLLIRLAQNEASSLTIAAIRLSLASLVLIPLALLRYRREIASLSSKEFILALGSGAFLAIHFAAWITSLAYTSVASSIVLVSTLPIWVAIASPMILGESAERRVFAGLALASLGSLLIALLDVCTIAGQFRCPPSSELAGGTAFIGDLLALVGAWSGAGYMLIGRLLRKRLSIIPYITLVYSASAVLLMASAILTGQQILGFSTPTYAWLVLLALVPQLLGHSSFNYALGHLPASFVSITLLGEPVGTIILAYFFLGEVPGMYKLVGAILILSGIIVASRVSTDGHGRNSNP